MFSLNESLTYYLYPRYMKMTGGIECLYELIRSEMGDNPLNGDVFLFFSKKRDQVMILRWESDGFILYQKRLELGTFELPRFKPGQGFNKLQWETFFMILRGIPLRTKLSRKRFKI